MKLTPIKPKKSFEPFNITIDKKEDLEDLILEIEELFSVYESHSEGDEFNVENDVPMVYTLVTLLRGVLK